MVNHDETPCIFRIKELKYQTSYRGKFSQPTFLSNNTFTIVWCGQVQMGESGNLWKWEEEVLSYFVGGTPSGQNRTRSIPKILNTFLKFVQTFFLKGQFHINLMLMRI